MEDKSVSVLTGGNMNPPVLRNHLIYKEATAATNTIHELLCHVRAKGIDWVPQSFGKNPDGKHVLSYIEGFVPQKMPDWIWKEDLLRQVALKLRQWHDATVDFSYKEARWLLDNDEKYEVICHNDFAPYNCVFEADAFKGLIDFDVCSPGSRLWDMAYTAYRFIPLYPDKDKEKYHEVSPFTKEAMMNRLKIFLNGYSCREKAFLYDETEIVKKVEKRLRALENWSESHGLKTRNQGMRNDAKMYALHAKWVKCLA